MARRIWKPACGWPSGTLHFTRLWGCIRMTPPKRRRKHSSDLASSGRHPKVLAIGEIGLDYHYDFSPRDVQREVFVEQMSIAGEAGKPIVIHTREAWDDTLALLREHWTGGSGIMHCFSRRTGGGRAGARPRLSLELRRSGHVSEGGDVQEAARLAPADRLLIETDAPYLAPVPNAANATSRRIIVETARKLAEVRGVSAGSDRRNDHALISSACCLRASHGNG